MLTQTGAQSVRAVAAVLGVELECFTSSCPVPRDRIFLSQQPLGDVSNPTVTSNPKGGVSLRPYASSIADVREALAIARKTYSRFGRYFDVIQAVRRRIERESSSAHDEMTLFLGTSFSFRDGPLAATDCYRRGQN